MTDRAGAVFPGRLGPALRFAFRELRGGIGGFRIFLACLALGVMAIAGVGSLSEALVAGLNSKGRSILGGDLSVNLMHRKLTPSEESWLRARYDMSFSSEMRSMVRALHGGRGGHGAEGAEGAARHALVELKAVDSLYPLFGSLRLSPDIDPAEAMGPRDGRFGAVVEARLLETLRLEIGDVIKIGNGSFPVTAVILFEPDRLSGGFSIGPRVMLSQAGAQQTGLYQPGSLVENSYRLRGKTPLSEADLKSAKALLDGTFPDAGWRLRDRTDAAPSLRQGIGRVAVFLTLAGLTALAVGGIGVGNAVHAHLDSRRNAIAIVKSLGASGNLVFLLYLLQVFLMALPGIFIGLAGGALTPFLTNRLFADLLPFGLQTALFPFPLAAAAGFGLLTSLAFALKPLVRARQVPVAVLFRDNVAPVKPRLPVWASGLYALCFSGLAAVSFLVVRHAGIAAWFLAGLLGSALVLKLAAGLVSGLARLAARRRTLPSPEFRMALGNICRPDAPTQAVMLSVGLAAALLSVISLVDGNLRFEISRNMPEGAPSFFLLDVQAAQLDGVKRLAKTSEGFRELDASPMLRGRLTHVKGVPVREVRAAPEVEWVLRGDRGLTYASEKPETARLVAGTWWPVGYDGPPLVSVDDEIAAGLGLKLGDSVTMDVLGRPLTAEISSLRKVDWESMGINFVFLFSPEPLSSAPHAHLMTVSTDAAGETGLRRDLVEAYPNVTVIRVKESLEAVRGILGGFSLAVRAVSVFSIITGILVLAGAIAGGHRKRIRDAAIMKVLGAQRRRILRVYLIEYGLTGLGAAIAAASIGTLSAWAVVRFVLDIGWIMMPATLAITIAGAALAATGLGLAGTWRTLGVRPARVLRSE